MGLVSDEFARARADKWTPRPMREKQPKYNAPIIQRPAAELWRIAADLPRDRIKEVKAFYHRLGKMSRPQIEAGLARFQRIARYATYG